MGDMVMLTVTGTPDQEMSLAGVAEQLKLPVEAFDAGFGVVALRPDKPVYAVRVDSALLPAQLPADCEVSGPYSDPKIAPFGPPVAGDKD